ncbi:actin cytoskeleton-regulatory complex protein PAN1 isoform X2 [Maniola jurtina]|nr:actin cytoskeleton-regulatory complex protein PAN1 isoform X2 [Maniola jurtina]XP_045768637.1 actin cytoskeleton-regulatory complex protein PAN1 isoform X2 [Maniola jurtina]
MECLQLRSPPGPFHYLISEQAKSLVALQELQNEVGALLEFRDLVIETFPNLRSKMAPSTPASETRRDWEPGVRVRRKLAGGSGDAARTKPQPSVQDSGFSTETSCGKDAHSSASASTSATRSRPLEDELWALLDVIQRKGVRLRDEAELLRGELDERPSETAEESFARALSAGCGDCTDLVRLRSERDALLARAAQLEAAAAATPPPPPSTPLGRLDSVLDTPTRPPRVASPDSKKFAAILLESNPVELQRQLLISTVQNQVLSSQLRRAAAQRTALLEKLERARDLNEDLKFRLEEKSIEVEGAKARLRQIEKSNQKPSDSIERSRDHSSMRDMEHLHIPDEADDEPRISETPRSKPSRIPRHTAHKGAAPRPPARSPAPGAPPRPPSAHSVRSTRSVASGRSRASREASGAPASTGASTGASRKDKSAVPVRRSPSADKKPQTNADERTDADIARCASLVAEYVARAERLAPLFPKLHAVRARPLPQELLNECRLAYETPGNLALELSKSILYENADSIDIETLKSLNSHEDSLWNGKPQQYFESLNARDGDCINAKDFEDDSLT